MILELPRIIPMETAHLTAAALLEEVCFSHPWSRAALEESLANPSSVFLAMVSGDLLAGYIGMYHVLDEGFIYNVAVDPTFRRKGTGSALVQALLDACRERDLATLTLEVRAGNQPAIGLYTKFGFAPVGVRKNYYRDPTEDALLMTHTL